MAVPDFQSLMLPLLRLTEDGKEKINNEILEILADQFKLSPEDRKHLLPSGRQATFDNRVSWAILYMVKANLLERTGRGKITITERGKKVLNDNPSKINIKFLNQFPEFVEARKRAPKSSDDDEDDTGKDQETPEEALEGNYQSLRQSLAQEILDQIKACSPRFFEKLVVDLLVAMGYGGSRKDAGQAIGQSGDEGIDGIIKEDKLGLDVVYIQAKRWENTVGRPVVQAFAGSLEGQRARKGVLITTSNFSKEATDYVSRIEKKIILIDGQELTQLMIDHGIGVSEMASYVVMRLDTDYFEE